MEASSEAAAADSPGRGPFRSGGPAQATSAPVRCWEITARSRLVRRNRAQGEVLPNGRDSPSDTSNRNGTRAARESLESARYHNREAAKRELDPGREDQGSAGGGDEARDVCESGC